MNSPSWIYDAVSIERPAILKLPIDAIPIDSDLFESLAAIDKKEKGQWFALPQLSNYVKSTMTAVVDEERQYELLKTLDFLSFCESNSIQYILIC